MSFEHQADSGSLFKNDRKEKESQPDYRGDALIDGKLYWMSAWLNESPKGTKYMSVKFSEKDKRDSAPASPAEKTPQQQRREAAPVDDFGDESVPF